VNTIEPSAESQQRVHMQQRLSLYGIAEFAGLEIAELHEK